MSEYWVSHKRYFCKYCNIYIADDAPSRKQHETGLKHKGNVERFVRGVYKAGEKRKQDLEEEKREMARIERAANAAYADDVAGGRARGDSSSRASSSAAAAAAAGPSQPKPKPKPSNPYTNYSTAESLGYVDPELERAEAEAARRQTEGLAGEWQVFDVAPPPADAAEGEAQAQAQVGDKRLAEAVPLLEDEESGRTWKLRRKTAGVGLGELYDPGELPIKLKAKKEEPVETKLGAPPPLGGSEKPTWSARGWNKPGEYSTEQTVAAAEASGRNAGQERVEEDEVKTEREDPNISREAELKGPPEPEVKAEEVKSEPLEPVAPPAPASGSLFKKRRAPAGGGSRGGRRI
ncbi:uncharacterized protein BXZ73DRAFT_97882 [Epithele typhae]|uniref:uncharacterized protein n=1 Tax=Epithele typhae TaxID=378194 RepID=UPI00200779DA|nr:uncharacterized protein BXZ73DRAFT_97882 [Epithele typhae]KAH9942473.1 hypothetical protein BXZ73DRAFT_97882 [Epithele typhae]